MASTGADDLRRAGGAPRQLALDLAAPPGFAREDFLVSGSNERAYAMIEAWPGWPDRVLLLIGPPGAGKSHLGAIWAAGAGAPILSGAALVEADLEVLAASPILLEDLDRVDLVEAKLFHLLNLVRESGAGLLVTARNPPEAWRLAVPDLVSRLRLAPRAEIGPPDDALMRAVLVKLLVDRQLVVDTRLVDFAVLRLGRSLDAARLFVDEVDRRALSLKSRITRTIAAEVIRALTGDDEAQEPGT